MGFAMSFGGGLDAFACIAKVKQISIDTTMRIFYVFLLGLSSIYAHWACMIRTIKKQLPSTVLEVSYIDPERLSVTRLYVFSIWRYLDLFAPREHVHLSWASSAAASSPTLASSFKTDPKGLYLIRMWNQANERQEGYVLSRPILRMHCTYGRT